jgi:hypothetical protein
MSRTDQLPPPGLAPARSLTSPTAWRVVGGLGLAHVLVLLGAFAVEGVASISHGASPAKVQQTYAGLSPERILLASYAESIAFLLLVPALVLLVRLLARRTEVGKVAGHTAVALGTAYVAATLAIGFPPLTAAVYAANHGIDAGTLATVNDVRNYAFVLQVALSMAFALAIGIAAVAERQLTRWVGWGGIVTGVVGIVATAFVPNTMSSLWLLWWLGVCVVCLRGGPRNA